MDRIQLRPRKRTSFSGFTNSEVQKLEKYFREFGKESTKKEFCVKTARAFSRREERAGKPVVKWDEIQQWFQTRQQESLAEGNVILILPNQISDIPCGSMGLRALNDTCAPVKECKRCPTPQFPSATEPNESNHLLDSDAHFFVRDMCTSLGAYEKCSTPKASSPSKSQLNEGRHLANVSKKQVAGEDRRTPVKPDTESLTTQILSLTELDENACAAVQSRERSLSTENRSPMPMKESTHFSDACEPYMGCKDACVQNRAAEANRILEGEKFPGIMELEFESRSSADGAWYDVETILTHRILNSGSAGKICRLWCGGG